MLAQRRPDEQVYVGPTSVSNVGPTESTTEKLRWPNVVMLSGFMSKFILIAFAVIALFKCSHSGISFLICSKKTS